MELDSEITFQQIIDATPEELLSLRFASSEPTSFNTIYIEILVQYLQGNSETLANLICTFPSALSSDDLAFLESMGRLRLQIRSRSIDQDLVQQVVRLAESQPKERKGEILFVVALAYETLGELPSMKKFHHLASKELDATGAKKKAIKAIHNFVAAESRIHPEKKLISDYSYVYKMAKRVKAYGVAGAALMNISREWA